MLRWGLTSLHKTVRPLVLQLTYISWAGLLDQLLRAHHNYHEIPLICSRLATFLQ